MWMVSLIVRRTPPSEQSMGCISLQHIWVQHWSGWNIASAYLVGEKKSMLLAVVVNIMQSQRWWMHDDIKSYVINMKN